MRGALHALLSAENETGKNSVCAECHAGAAWGYQYSKWQGSQHADAYASLGTAKAREMAAAAGVTGDPRTSAQCLKCHATAYRQPAAEVLDTYAVHEGVSCEACHGAGSGHAEEAAANQDSSKPLAVRMAKTTEQTCAACHTNVDYVVERANTIQKQVYETMIATEDAIVEAITAIKA